MNITKQQIKTIHVLIHRIGMSDEDYRAMLMDNFGVSSCKQLRSNQAKQLIQTLYKLSGQKPKKRFDELNHRPSYFASPAQLRKIEAMWANVSYKKTARERRRALNAFIKRITGVSDLLWLQANDVHKVIKAIQTMEKRHETKN